MWYIKRLDKAKITDIIRGMEKVKSKVNPIIFQENKLFVLDQRLLPHEKKYIEARSYKEVIEIIHNMALRGAPLIGIAAAYGMILAANEFKDLEANKLKNKLKVIGEEIKNSRPTAVNLKWAVDLIIGDINSLEDTKEIVKVVEARAIWIHTDDAFRCQKIGEHGTRIIEEIRNKKINHGATVPQHHVINILTICNTGALATGGIGTAFGVILTAHKKDPNIKVYASETRPRQQGARLTTFECLENGIDCTLITDTACGYLMQKGEIDLVFCGADRIAANGDTANKIGTYQLAILAKEHNIPFYVAAPLSTFDLSCKSGKEIPIEERSEQEVIEINEKEITPKGVRALNPAFDITPAKYITSIITEKDIVLSPYIKSILRLFNEPALA